MDKYEVKNITDQKIWEDFLISNNPKTFLQSWAWGEVNDSLGSKVIRLGFYDSGKLVGVAQMVKERAKRGPHLLLPAGPIFNWEDTKLRKFILKSIYDRARQENSWFVRIRPEITNSEKTRTLFKNMGLISAPMHLNAENTWILDITKSEEDLLKGMRKTTRYLVNRSLKEGLKIEKTISIKDAKILFDLQKETSIRHNFVAFPLKLFEKEIEIFAQGDNLLVFKCIKDKKVLAIALIIFYGDTAYYHFSASTSDYSKIPFSYFLQWQVILEAKKRGIKYYNFWGIAPNDNPHHRFAGVTLFKTGFGGERVDWLHAHDLVISPLYWLTYVFESIRRVTRKL